MAKQLVTFGDSWPAGEELDSANLHYRFPDLIAKSLSVESRNLSQPATSIDHAVSKFLNNLDQLQDSAVLFCLTARERSIYFQDNDARELHPHRKDLPSLSYYSYIYSDQLAEFNRIRNVLLVQELCEKFRIPLMFICNWNHAPQHSVIESHKFYPQSLVEILGMSNFEDDDNFFVTRERNVYIKPNQGHPNVQGHQLIASTLTNWIKEKI
jgi:hypothetical protein